MHVNPQKFTSYKSDFNDDEDFYEDDILDDFKSSIGNHHGSRSQNVRFLKFRNASLNGNRGKNNFSRRRNILNPRSLSRSRPPLEVEEVIEYYTPLPRPNNRRTKTVIFF